MLKQRLIQAIVAAALIFGLVGGTGIIADEVGLSVTSPAQACNHSGSSGGGC